VIAEIFKITDSDNCKDPSSFNAIVRSGLGDPRRAQLRLRYAL
jgi:hypothetical protein